MLRTLLIGPEDGFIKDFVSSLPGIRELELARHVPHYPPPDELLLLLEDVAPDAVVISLADYNRALRAIGRLALAKPQLPVVALHSYCDQQLLLELMQVGVRELWFPPLNLERIQQTVNRILEQKVVASGAQGPASPPLGTLMAFLPARGGCGTTTIAAHTAAALQRVKGSVLLADFDFHNSVVAFWMKVAPRHGFQEALERAHWLDASQWNSLVIRVGTLDILTAPQASSPVVFSGDETSAVLEFARQNYQFVLVDLPDAIYSSCWEVLDQANQILIVATPEMASLYLARRKVAQIVDHGIPRNRIRILLSRCSAEDLQPAEVEKFLSLPVTASFGNHYKLVTSAFSDGKFVPEDSKLGLQFLHFAEAMAGLPESKESKKKTGASKIRQLLSLVPDR